MQFKYFNRLIRIRGITAIIILNLGCIISAYAGNPASTEYVDSRISTLYTLITVQGLPSGGNNGEILTKRSATSYDTYWAPPPMPATMDGGTYHLEIADLINSLIEIPTSNVSVNSSTIASSDLAGSTSLLDENGNNIGTFAVTFLSIQSAQGITSTIENHIVTTDGLIVNWPTLAAPANLNLPTLMASIATENIVTDTTRSGSSVFFGRSFDLLVTTDGSKITFRFNPLS